MEERSRRLVELAQLFTRLGFTAFGGPAAHIAMMHDEVVVRRQWLDDQHFLDMVGATNLVPGPNSTEMAMHVGQTRAGWRGLLVAGFCFIIPAVLIVTGLAWAYVRFGSTPEGEALLYGIKPVIIAVVLQALARLGKIAIKDMWLAIAGIFVVGFYLAGINELVLLFGAGALIAILQTTRQRLTSVNAVAPFLAFNGFIALFQNAAPVRLDQLFWVFLKAGALLYGSGYVLLAFLHNDLVSGLGWLTDQQLLDAVAVGQFTPGPVFTTATFIGYVLAGVPGAIVATVGIFLPAFCYVAVLNRIVPVMRRSRWTSALLDGVNVAALGLMAGVLWQLGRAAIFDWPTALLAAVSAVLLFRFRINSAWLILAGGAIGLLVA